MASIDPTIDTFGFKSSIDSLNLKFKVIPKRFGFYSSLNSHYLGKKFDFDLQFLPKPSLKVKLKRVDKSNKKNKGFYPPS